MPSKEPVSCHTRYLRDVAWPKCNGGPGKHDVLVLVKVVFKGAERQDPCYRLGFMASLEKQAHSYRGRQHAYAIGPHTARTWHATKTFGFNTRVQAQRYVDKVRSRPKGKHSVTASLTSNKTYRGSRGVPLAGGHLSVRQPCKQRT